MNNLIARFRRFPFEAFRIGSVRFSSADPSPDPNPKPKAKRKGSYVSIAQQIYDSLRESKTFIANYDRITPGLFWIRSSTPPTSWYCLSESTAGILFRAIEARLSPGDTVIEMNPGLGLITKKLLSSGVSRVWAYEPDANFREILSPLAASHPELTVIPKHFFNISKEDFKGRMYGDERLSEFLPDLKPADWKADPTLKIIGTVPSYKFIQYLLLCVTFQRGLMKYGRPEFFFITTPELLVQLTCDQSSPYMVKKKLSRFLLFSIYFDLECVSQVDAKSFVPWFKRGKGGSNAVVPDFFVFIRAVPKRDLYDYVPPHMLKPLWFFVCQAVLRPKYKVIPFLEKWIPGCGPLFIVKGLSVFTEFRELSPPEMVDVFLTFVNHPDYASSLFDEAVESFVFKSDSDALGDAADGAGDRKSAEQTDNVQDGSADKKAA